MSVNARINAENGRVFATFPGAVIVFVVDDRERLLVFSSPRRPGWWEVINGAMEDGEAVLDAAMRELGEEGGAQLRARPLGVFHVESFDYDPTVRRMLSICYLMQYIGGPVEPGDDMEGSHVAWWTPGDVSAHLERCIPPLDHAFLAPRALECFRLWRDRDEVLQPRSSTFPGKTRLSGPPAT